MPPPTRKGPSRSGPNRGPSRGSPPHRGGPPQRFAPPPRPPEPEQGKAKEEAIELDGVITAVLAGTMFRVKLRNATGHEVLAHISGKMRKKFIRLVIGDAVKIEMSPYDMDKARIVYRIG